MGKRPNPLTLDDFDENIDLRLDDDEPSMPFDVAVEKSFPLKNIDDVSFDRAQDSLPKTVDIYKEMLWVASHPAMLRMSRGEVPVILDQDDVLNQLNGSAPSRRAVAALQFYANNPDKFHREMALVESRRKEFLLKRRVEKEKRQIAKEERERRVKAENEERARREAIDRAQMDRNPEYVFDDLQEIIDLVAWHSYDAVHEARKNEKERVQDAIANMPGWADIPYKETPAAKDDGAERQEQGSAEEQEIS